MDPNACFADLLYAVAEGNLDDADEHAQNLSQWLAKGGFYPGDGKIRHSAIDAFLTYVLEQ
jgi:hypothetical protein